MAGRQIEYLGKKQSPKKWSDELGIPLRTITARLEAGLPVEQVLYKQPGGNVGRQIKDGIVVAFLQVWEESGEQEFISQLREAFNKDALKVIKEFREFLPKDVELPRQRVTVQKAVMVTSLKQLTNDEYEPI